MRMSLSALRKLCREHELYSTPALNETLYCNFQGFTSIADLDYYTALKSLFLEGNALTSLEGLPSLVELKCLYVQQNSLSNLKYLWCLKNLEVLNVSNNELVSLEGIAGCPRLHTLLCSSNQLGTLESLAELTECTALNTLDLQTNKIKDPQVLEHLQQFSEMRSLYLRDNPFLDAVHNSRKTIIASMPLLTYLDDRPVFDIERCCAEAWMSGGQAAESAAREKFQADAAAKERDNFETLQAMRRESFRKRRETLGLPPGDTDPFYDTLKDKDLYEEVQEVENPPELLEAQAKLADLWAASGVSGAEEASVSEREQDASESFRSALAVAPGLPVKGAGKSLALQEPVTAVGEAKVPGGHAGKDTVSATEMLASNGPAANAAKESALATEVVLSKEGVGHEDSAGHAAKNIEPASEVNLGEDAAGEIAKNAAPTLDMLDCRVAGGNSAGPRALVAMSCKSGEAAADKTVVGASFVGQGAEQEGIAISGLDLDGGIEEVVPMDSLWEDDDDEGDDSTDDTLQLEVIGRGLKNIFQGLRAAD